MTMMIFGTRISRASRALPLFSLYWTYGASPSFLPPLGRYSVLGPQRWDPQWSLVGSQGAWGSLLARGGTPMVPPRKRRGGLLTEVPVGSPAGWRLGPEGGDPAWCSQTEPPSIGPWEW